MGVKLLLRHPASDAQAVLGPRFAVLSPYRGSNDTYAGQLTTTNAAVFCSELEAVVANDRRHRQSVTQLAGRSRVGSGNGRREGKARDVTLQSHFRTRTSIQAKRCA